jgi:hypothetical protein
VYYAVAYLPFRNELLDDLTPWPEGVIGAVRSEEVGKIDDGHFRIRWPKDVARFLGWERRRP